MEIIAIFIAFFSLLLLGIPIAIVIGIVSLGYLFIVGGIPLELIPQRIFLGIDKYPMMAIPFFILAAEIMIEIKIIRSIINFADTLVGHIKGGLAHVNVVASFLFAGISGSAIADAAGLGSVEIPMMLAGGYPKRFSAAITAASSVIGPIVPPSVIFIIYALVAQNVSVAALLLAGFVPGILLAIGLMALCYWKATRWNVPLKERRARIKEIFLAFKEAFLPLLMPVILLGGILLGVFTATESAAVACAYGMFIGFFVLKRLTLRALPKIFLRASLIAGAVLWIVATANVLTWILTSLNIARILESFFLDLTSNPYVFLLVMNLLFLLIGCLLEGAAAIIIFTPILLPLAMSLGIHPVHFGVIVVLNLMIGVLTPPVGVVLYVISNVAKISIEELIKEIWPFVLAEIAALAFITYFPWLTLIVPKLCGLI